jgi:histidine triad (HIT) family protein
MTRGAHESECQFCAIVEGTIPSHAIYKDDSLYAFLDIHPIRPGHVQILPRAHYAYFDDLPPALAAKIIQLGQRLAVVLKPICRVRRVAFLFTGGDVAHAHAHVVPLGSKTDITSRRYIVEEKITFRCTPAAPDPELEEMASRIRGALGTAAKAEWQIENSN